MSDADSQALAAWRRQKALNIVAEHRPSGRPTGVLIESLIRDGADPWEPFASLNTRDRVLEKMSALERLFARLSAASYGAIERWLCVLDGIGRTLGDAAVPFDRMIVDPCARYRLGTQENERWRRALGIERLATHMKDTPAVREMLERVAAKSLGEMRDVPIARATVTIEEIALMGESIVSDDLLRRFWLTPVARGLVVPVPQPIASHPEPLRTVVLQEVAQASRGPVPHLLRLVACSNYKQSDSDIDPDVPVRLLGRVLERLRSAGVDLEDPASVGLSVHSAMHVAFAGGSIAVPQAMLQLGLDVDRRGAAGMSPAEIFAHRQLLEPEIARARAERSKAMLRASLERAAPGGAPR